MTSSCQNCPERRLVCHDYCDTYLKYHADCLAARAKRRAEYEAEEVVITSIYRYVKQVKRKKR